MKRLLFALGLGLIAQTSFAQCNPAFTPTMAPQNNNLLRLGVNNTTTIPTGNKITSFELYWGDGQMSYVGSGNAYHNYATASSYNVKLVMTVWDSVGGSTVLNCKDSVTQSVTVAYTACATSFTITKTSPNSVSVTATNPAGTSGMTYSWNWGDGTPNGSGATATHTYATNGTKKITLTATNGSCTYNNDQNVSITGSCNSGVANFSSSTNSTTVNLTATSTVISGYTNYYDWNFGDGNSSNNNVSKFASHTYAASGTYPVTLITRWADSAGIITSCLDTVTKNVTVTLINKITGTISQDSFTTMPIDSPVYKVWLISFDSASNTLSAVDSTTVYGAGTVAFYQFLGAAAGSYRVKAHMLNGPTSGAGWVPTYHYNSLMWNTATVFAHTGGTVTGKHIMMQSGTVTAGPGFIGGNVSAGANKGTGAGIEGMTIILLDGNGNLVSASTTDVNGNYFFDKLPAAGYSVYPEDLGFATTPVSVTVVNNKPTVTNINFERSMSMKTITPAPTAINNIDNSVIEFAVYPNPAKDQVTIKWNSNISKTADVTLTDITGKKVYSTTVSGNGHAALNLGDLNKGLYFISISSNNVQDTKKLLLQ